MKIGYELSFPFTSQEVFEGFKDGIPKTKCLKVKSVDSTSCFQ